MPPLSSNDDRTRLLLVVDVAGALHCYRYVVQKGSGLEAGTGGSGSSDGDDDDDEPMAVLKHLWSRDATGQGNGPVHQVGENRCAETDAMSHTASCTMADPQTSAPPAAEAGLGGYQCSLSKQLRRLQAHAILSALRATATPAASHTSATPAQTDAVPPAASATSAASFSSTGAAGVARSSAATLCPFCASSSPRGPKAVFASSSVSPRLSGVSRATSSQSPSRASVTASATSTLFRDSNGADATSVRERPATSAAATGAGEEPLFCPGHFMARVPEVPASHPVAAASTSATSLDEGLGAAGGAPTFVLAVQVGGPSSEVGWYWRCPRSMIDACDTTTATAASVPAEASPDASATTAHVWVPLSEAVRQWNVLCCRHHRLLLLRHMEEEYSEIDLLTGQAHESTELTAAVVAAAAAAPLDGSLSDASSSARSRSWSSASTAETSDCDGSSEESSTDLSSAIRVEPRAVLSLTAQRHQILLMQASPARQSKASATAKRAKAQPEVTQRGSARRPAASPTSPQAAHQCLAKFAAPAIQMSLTWHSGTVWRPSTSFTMTSVDETASDEEKEKEEWGATPTEAAMTRDAAGAAASHAKSPTHLRLNSNSSSSSNNSTSASDIDLDVLAGRKRFPVKNRCTRPATSKSSSTSSDAAGGGPRRLSGKSNASEGAHNTRAAANARASTARASLAFDDIPLRCGPDGCVYGVSRESGEDGTMSEGDTDNEAFVNPCGTTREPPCTTPTAPPPMLLLLQLPVPLLEALWIVLPPSSAWTAEAKDGAASWPLDLRRVPWLPRDARSLRAVELSGPVSEATATSTTSQLPGLNIAGGLATMRGFLLQISAATPDAAALSARCPQVLRPLSTYDVLGARVLCDQQRWTRPSRTGVESAKPRGKRSSTSASTSAVKAGGQGRQPRTNSSASSFLGGSGSSIAHRISPPPHHFVPTTSFFDENFEPLALLGRGVGGAALLARHRVTGVSYAVKVLIARDYESERDILQEMRVHAMLDNRHVVRYHACWSEVVSATRAQQLAFIGVCHPYEANVPRRAQWRSHKASGKELIEAGKGLRSAPGGWHHLMLPSNSSMVLVGSESMSESVTPHLTQRGLSQPQLRDNKWSTALVDECASNAVTTSSNDEREEELGAENEVSTARASAPRAPIHGGTTRTLLRNGHGRARSLSSSASSSLSTASSASSENKKGGTRPFTWAEEGEVRAAAAATGGSAGDSGGPEAVSRLGSVLWSRDEDADSGEGASTGSGNELRSPRPRHSDPNDSTAADSHSGTVIGSRVVFLQMELCQVTLAQYLTSRKAVDRVENLIILLQIISGLRYLHQRAILHRDLKPTNVFMDYRCQHDDAMHHASSSSSASSSFSCEKSSRSTSSSDDGSSEDDVNACESFSASLVACGPGTGGSALTLRRRHPGACPPSAPSGAGRAAPAWSAPHQPRAPPGTLAAAAAAHRRLFPTTLATTDTLAGTSLDNLPTWDAERTALEVVMRAPHRTAAEMLVQRLQRRPPPPRLLASWASPLRANLTGNARKAGSPTQSRSGRRFLRHLAGWLRHRFVQVRLGDFGLAKFIDQQELGLDGFLSMNAPNTVGVGSPLYASPEQLKGSRCTAASDAFSLGLVLAEMYLQPNTIAERLTVLREVRDGVYHDAVLLTRYPELKLVRRLTAMPPERRMTLKEVHRAFAAHLAAALSDEVRNQFE